VAADAARAPGDRVSDVARDGDVEADDNERREQRERAPRKRVLAERAGSPLDRDQPEGDQPAGDDEDLGHERRDVIAAQVRARKRTWVYGCVVTHFGHPIVCAQVQYDTLDSRL